MLGWRVGLLFCLGCGGAEKPSAPLVDGACIRHAHERAIQPDDDT